MCTLMKNKKENNPNFYLLDKTDKLLKLLIICLDN